MSCIKRHLEDVSVFLGYGGDIEPLMAWDQCDLDEVAQMMKDDAELTADGFPPQCI